MITPWGHSGAGWGNAQDPFASMNNMMGNMMQSFFGGGNDGFGGPFGSMGGGMMQSFGGFGSSSSFSCQTMSFSSSVGPDGRTHTEEFSSSTVADGRLRARETKQAYANSTTGVEKLSMERTIGERGRKVVKEHSIGTGEEKRTDILVGVSEEDGTKFTEEWQEEVAPHLPSHRVQLQLGNGNSSSSSHWKGNSKGFGSKGAHNLARRALPAPTPEHDDSQADGGWQQNWSEAGESYPNRSQHRWRSTPY